MSWQLWHGCIHMTWTRCIMGTRAKPGNHLVFDNSLYVAKTSRLCFPCHDVRRCRIVRIPFLVAITREATGARSPLCSKLVRTYRSIIVTRNTFTMAVAIRHLIKHPVTVSHQLPASHFFVTVSALLVLVMTSTICRI